jgi:REP element-mobilizing transposase RayT
MSGEITLMTTYWHITLVTHNSRVSERMIKYNVKKGMGVWFDERAECVMTQIISDIVKTRQYNVYAYNICKDHVHMLLECEKEKLTDAVKTIIGIGDNY